MSGEAVARLHVRVKPNARRTQLIGRMGDAVRVDVAAAPERGRANEELIEILAAALHLPRESFAIAAGQSSRDKHLRIRGIDAAELERRLSAALGGTGGDAGGTPGGAPRRR